MEIYWVHKQQQRFCNLVNSQNNGKLPNIGSSIGSIVYEVIAYEVLKNNILQYNIHKVINKQFIEILN